MVAFFVLQSPTYEAFCAGSIGVCAQSPETLAYFHQKSKSPEMEDLPDTSQLRLYTILHKVYYYFL